MTLQTPSLEEHPFESIKLAMCQVQTERWEVEDNFKRVLAAIDEAAEKGAEIAITPECVFHGYSEFQTPDFTKEEVYDKLIKAAEPINGGKIEQLKAKAKQLKMHIMVGFAELGPDNQVYNSAALILNTGEIAYVYRKVHCRDFEDINHTGFFTPGNDFFVQEVEFKEGKFNIGTMICFDREIPESVPSLRAQDAHIILCPLATNTSNINEIEDKINNEIITRCRSAENEVFIVVVNHAVRFNGGSFITGPSGEVVVQMNEKPAVEVFDIPLGIIPEEFHSKPLGWMGWGFKRNDIYHKYK